MNRYAPPGINLRLELIEYWMTILVGISYSITFFFDFHASLNALYEFSSKNKYLIEGARMIPFETLMEGRLNGFVFTAIILVVLTIGHYAYHYNNQGSKSIYLMKRLPNKWELHKRCLILPSIGAVIAVLIMVLLWFTYLGVYYVFTPQQCLPY